MKEINYLKEMRSIPKNLSSNAKREVYEDLPRLEKGFRKRIDAIISESARQIGVNLLSSSKVEEIIDIGISAAIVRRGLHEKLSRQDIETIKKHLKQIYLNIINTGKPREILNEIIMRIHVERDSELSRLLYE